MGTDTNKIHNLLVSLALFVCNCEKIATSATVDTVWTRDSDSISRTKEPPTNFLIAYQFLQIPQFER